MAANATILWAATDPRSVSYDTARTTDAESVLPEDAGAMHFLKEPLASDHLGFTVLELEPGVEGLEHDEADSGQEEIYYVVEGSVTVEVEDESVSLGAAEAIRIDPGTVRQIRNDGDERATLVLAGAPL